MGPSGRPTRAAPPAPRAASNPLEALDHLVIVLQENHTFDSYFGTYPGADGLQGKPIRLPATPGAPPTLAPFHSATRTPKDLPHGWPAAHADFDGGRMDGFVYTEGDTTTLGYFDRTDLPRYWAAADEYVLCDHHFTSVMSQSAPNHLYLLAGQSGGLQNNQVPATLPFPPVFEGLDRLTVNWKVYGFTRWCTQFDYVQRTPSARARLVAGSEFARDLSAGNLPQVSWVIGAPGGSEHPPADVRLGENSVADDIINAVGRSPYWGSSAIVVTWDDYGGFYDHVAPPQVDAMSYGFRVPCLIVSPYAKRGFVDPAVRDHTSILRFVENRFGVAPLAARDAAAVDLSAAFDFAQPPRAFVPI